MPIILVFGTSGCNKASFLESLCRGDKRFWKIELEKEWELHHQTRWTTLLDQPTAKRRNALKETIVRLKSNLPGNKIVLLGLHATHLVEASLSSPAPIDVLKDIGVDFCITVFDDLAAVRHRLAKRGFHYNFQQLLLWRSAELLAADLISEEVAQKFSNRTNIRNFFIAVKHPLSTVRKLLTNLNCIKVYSAYSISGVIETKNPDLRLRLKNETIKYRKELLMRNIVVFDPGTLDDRLLISKLRTNKLKQGYNTVNFKERWPYLLGRNKNLHPAVVDPKNLFPLRIQNIEAYILKKSLGGISGHYNQIDAHITQIDLRYVAQADFITVWRPFNQGTPSLGCRREVEYATVLERPVIAYSTREDKKLLEEKPRGQSRPLDRLWVSSGGLLENQKEFWVEIDKIIQQFRK